MSANYFIKTIKYFANAPLTTRLDKLLAADNKNWAIFKIATVKLQIKMLHIQK